MGQGRADENHGGTAAAVGERRGHFLACQQLTQLDLQAARRERRPAREFDIGFQDLVRRGEEHELTVLDQFLAQGHEVADLTHAEDPAGATKAAIQAEPR